MSFLVWLASVSLLTARLPAPEMIPLERLVRNAEGYAERHPDEAVAYYIIGRIHHLAFANGAEPIAVPINIPPPGGGEFVPMPVSTPGGVSYFDRDQKAAERHALKVLGLPDPIPIGRWEKVKAQVFWLQNEYLRKHLYTQVPIVTSLDWPTRLKHAEEAEKNYRKAMRLDPRASLYVLSLADLEECFDATVSSTPGAKLPPGKERWSTRAIRDLYRQAFTMASPPEGDWMKYFEESEKLGRNREAGEFWVKHAMVYTEAGWGYVRVSSRSSARPSKEERKFLAAVKHGLERRWEFDKKYPGAISPIIFSFTPHEAITEMLIPEADVTFDLSGFGGSEHWPWVRPDTGFLVWDPQRSGRIASARQMFGTYTFGIPRENGYRALAGLDDNGDGFLTGAELHGLAVWFDANGDAVSDQGEVVPVEDVGITSIAVDEMGFEGIHPTNPRGVMLRDGTWLATWDWMVAPHR